MSVRHHPSDETLAAYASGSLDLGRRLVVASHVERCATCRGFVRGAETIAGVMLEDLSPARMSSSALKNTLARLDQKPAAKTKPAATNEDESYIPASLRPYELGRWRWVGPGVQMRPVLLPKENNISVFFLKGAPGIKLPQHSHEGAELTSILAGSYTHEGGHFGAGDFEDADDDIEHRPIVGDEGCICLVALEGQLKLSGIIGALMNPFVRF